MFYKLVITQPIKMLQNLKAILEKAAFHAEMKKYDVEVLLHSRLAPDQFNLLRQIQIVCDTAKFGASRLADKEAPRHEDNEKTIDELLLRIDSVINYLQAFTENDFSDAASRKISHPRWDGKYLYGTEFLLQHVVPNIYFHTTTAYAILRHNGVDLGKKDYLGDMPFKQ